MGNTFQKMVSSDPFPPSDSEPTFDPMYGFPKERKERGKYLIFSSNL